MISLTVFSSFIYIRLYYTYSYIYRSDIHAFAYPHRLPYFTRLAWLWWIWFIIAIAKCCLSCLYCIVYIDLCDYLYNCLCLFLLYSTRQCIKKLYQSTPLPPPLMASLAGGLAWPQNMSATYPEHLYKEYPPLFNGPSSRMWRNHGGQRGRQRTRRWLQGWWRVWRG